MELQDGPGGVAIRVLNVGLLGVLVDGVVHLGAGRRSEAGGALLEAYLSWQ